MPASSADLQPLVSREQARNTIADAIRLFVGRGRRYSVKQLSNGTRVPDWQINAALVDASKPDHRPLPPEALLSISAFLGADFTNEWLGLAYQGAFDFPDEDDPRPGDMAVEAAENAATVARAAADGAFGPDDHPALRVVGARMKRSGAMLVRMAGQPAVGRRRAA